MFSDTTSIVANVGIMIVISALFIILFYRQYSQMQKMLNKYIDTLERGQIPGNMSNRINVQHDEALKIRIQITQKVNNILALMSTNLQAQRAMICEFHNTSVNLTGLPFAKSTVTFEYFAEGQKPFIQEYQASAISPMIHTINQLYNNDIYIFENVDNPKEAELSMTWHFKQRNAGSGIVVPLRDYQHNIYGVIIFDFDGQQSAKEWTWDKINEKIERDANRIASLLSLQHFCHY